MIVDKEIIKKAKTNLGDDNAQLIADILGLQDYSPITKKALCPFHEEDTPSFIYNPKNGSFHCFGCGRNIDAIGAYMAKGDTYLEATEKYLDKAGIPASLGEKGVRTRYQYRYPKADPLNEKTAVKAYLATRKISPSTVDAFDVRESEKGDIAFNYYDTNDVLTLVKYRPARKVAKGENKAWCQRDADTSPILFNMNRVAPSAPLIICEGEIDAMAMYESGYPNVVSVPFGAGNYTWIEENYDWLEQFDSIIICSDNDEPGGKMQQECIYRLGSWRTKFIDIPHEIATETGKRVRVKDVNEVLYYAGKDAVMELVRNAKDTPVPSVQDLSEVDDINLDEIDGIDIGIDELDKKLMRLFYGTLTVVSGAPGSGKTSFLSQLACQAMEQDKRVWLFSREMPGWMTKNWLNSILAGRHHINEYRNEKDSVYYRVDGTTKQKINEFYKGMWYVYKDDASNKLDDLLQSMEDSVRKYGTKLLILDNLMTIDIGADADSAMLKQTDAINALIAFAMKYNVAVVLVAHPRKLQNGVDMGMYDISGTANIINLAHRTLGVKRLNKSQSGGYDVAVTIIKDRMRGRAGDVINIYYDVPSRRFYTNPEEYNYQYKWDDGEYPILTYPHTEDEEIFGAVDYGSNIPKLS